MHPTSPFRHASAVALLCSAAALTGCGGEGGSGPAEPSSAPAAFAKAPATGNGHKLVLPINADLPSVDCGGGPVLEAHIEGWIQVRLFDRPGSRTVELDVFHTVTTYTNSAGKTYAFHDVGPDRYHVEGDNLILESSGRIGGGLIGHIVINLTTGEVELVAGKEFPGAGALACEALT
jgi:hypothetical protein